MTNLEIRNDFPILKDNKIAYLDSGATAQRPIQVIEAVENFYKTANANPHRGAYSLSVKATEAYDNAHEKVAKFINAKEWDEIAFTKNATEALNLIAYSYGLNNLKQGDEIVLSILEHHSNLVPWQYVAKKTGATLKYMYIDENYEIPDDEIYSKITDKTKIVGITHVSNGKIDEKKLFYIMTKGISYENAKKLIVKANFNSIVKDIPNDDLQNYIMKRVDII